MAHHHKSNRAVEGDPDYGHGRGMPRRADEDELEQRTVRDREEAGRPVKDEESPDEEYRAAQEEVDRQAEAGEMPTGADTRKERDPFPPTHYGKP